MISEVAIANICETETVFLCFSEMEITLEMLNEIPSIQDKTAKKIIESLAEIKHFIKEQ